MNSQKFTILILNSIVVLSLSASLAAVSDSYAKHPGVNRTKYTLGVMSTLATSVCSVGVVGLIFVVSPLFSSAISTFSISLTPLAIVDRKLKTFLERGASGRSSIVICNNNNNI
ncbi:hypothetical protein L6452_30657 [Arctium lappa]|uniref:Uncharacterized protein n=1 Tax=Arctium lappa TaxID=4217 RepID=A0ACB8ZIN5_ARCLA|nr:hypothetical protein L6452_30657 [Arctium lappa]